MSSSQNPRGSVWVWWVVLAGALVAFRWPVIWLPHEVYPDESQLLAGAITLRHDPVFWRSVDGGTAGPLDYFALLPAAGFSAPTSYAITRLTATLLIWGLLVAAGETIALIAKRPVARLAILPALLFEAFTTSAEFFHYSTELVPDFLLALAVLLIVRQTIRPARWHLWSAALLLGATPFAKLQAGPIAAGLGLLLVFFEICAGRRKNLGLLVIFALLPTLLVAMMVTMTGQTENLLIPYFLQNAYYSQTGHLPFSDVVLQLGQQSATTGYHALWFAGSAIFCLGTIILARNIPGPLLRYGLGAIGLLVVTIFCVLSPARPYHHYLNLLTLPVTLVTGVALGFALASRRAGSPDSNAMLPLGLFVLCCLLPLVAWRISNQSDPYEYYNHVVSAPSPAHRQLVEEIRRLSLPGESLGIWGWRSSLYVETGLPQATRLAHTEALTVGGPWQKYYLRRYYDDLVASAPPVFADATGPGNFRFTDRAMGHEIFPLLRVWIRTHYQFMGDLDGVRLYVRLDRVPAAGRTSP